MFHLAQQDRVAEMQIGRRGIEAGFHAQRASGFPGFLEARAEVFFTDQLGESFFQVFELLRDRDRIHPNIVRVSRELLEKMPPPGAVRLVYGDAPQQFAELRLPEGAGPHPVVMLVHGGFWRSHRSLSHMAFLGEALALEGVATWNVEYRRLGDAGGGWPATCEDVRSAGLMLQRIAPEHRLDASRVVVVGFSAGGQIALWLAAERAVHLCGAVSLGGLIHLQAALEMGLGNGGVEEFLGGIDGDLVERVRAASPASRVPLGVRQRVLHGIEDDIVPVEISRRYCAAARAAGDDVELIELDGTGHFEAIDPASHAWPVVRAAVLELLGGL
jgi:acetyl esterase/lipase